jgi:hypothetical protein
MMFLIYLRQDDFVGADMARKFLMMGWTRARRYANHPSGRKYAADGTVLAQATDHATNDKAKSAEIFKRKYDKARLHSKYLKMKQDHQQR